MELSTVNTILCCLYRISVANNNCCVACYGAVEAAFNLHATEATMPAPLPDPSSDSFMVILLPGANSCMAAFILHNYNHKEHKIIIHVTSTQ